MMMIMQPPVGTSSVCGSKPLLVESMSDEDIICSRTSVSECNNSGRTIACPCTKNLGLINLGNTCYLNAAIQMICCQPEFLQDLKRYDEQQKASTGKLRKALLQLVGDMCCCLDPEESNCCYCKSAGGNEEEEKKEDSAMGMTSTAADPSALKSTMDEICCLFEGYQQQDSHEFLSTLLDMLHDEIMEELKEQQHLPPPATSSTSRTTSTLGYTQDENDNCDGDNDKNNVKRSRLHPSDKSSSFSTLDQDAIFSLLHEEIPLDGCTSTVAPTTVASIALSNNDTDPPLLLLGGRIAPSCLTDNSPTDITASLQLYSATTKLKPSTTNLLPFPKHSNNNHDIRNQQSSPRVITNANLSSSSIAAAEETVLSNSIIISPIEKHFCSFVDVRLTCDSCSYTRSKTEMYRYLSIDLVMPQPNVEDGLKRFFLPEKIDLKCEKCFFERATQTKKIVKFPKSLLIHFKRFLVTTTLNDGIPSTTFTKNHTPVDFYPTLDTMDFLHGGTSEDCDTMKDNAHDEYDYYNCSSKFRLVSVVHHIGRNASCGHYTADGLRTVVDHHDAEIRRQWLNFNDDYVTDKEEYDVVHGTAQASSAYMILYEATS
jgi:ubiquitin C-terminal hydrolase